MLVVSNEWLAVVVCVDDMVSSHGVSEGVSVDVLITVVVVSVEPAGVSVVVPYVGAVKLVVSIGVVADPVEVVVSVE